MISERKTYYLPAITKWHIDWNEEGGYSLAGGAVMKTKVVLLAMAVMLMTSVASAHYRPHGPARVSFGVFYSSLSPHGEWIVVDRGLYAWRPIGVPIGWRPYTVGRWVWTVDGWYWFSDEPWGWAAYHYGRWYYDDFYGWVWIPGYDWAPAWVEWRYGGDYVGWAPLGPYAVFNIRLGIYYTTHWVTPIYYWSFVDCRYIVHSHINKYVYRPEHNTRYIGRTRGAGSVRYDGGRIISRGPEREFVERRGKVSLERTDIIDASDRPQERILRDGNRERIEVYRPRIEEGNMDSDRPEKVRSAERPLTLDAKRLDATYRSEQRESGRGLKRAEDARQHDGERVAPSVRPEDRTSERATQRSAERRSDNTPRKDGTVDRSRAEDRVRTQSPERRSDDQVRQPARREETRSPNPERTIRRSESQREGRSNDSPRPDRRR
jgi:hypothetical protein